MGDLSLTELIRTYIGNRETARLEKFDKDAEKQRKDLAKDPNALAELELELVRKRKEEEERYKPAVWLSDAANRARQISMVTHALKYTHTDAKGTSVFASPAADGGNSLRYLTTSSLQEPATDVVGNAAALDVAALLLLKGENETLVKQVARGDASALSPLAENEQQLAEWLAGFKAALADRELSSHKLAKQVYFPVGDNEYHLLSPLYASSLAHALHERIVQSRFSEESKLARKARREEKYSETPTTDFLGVAVQSFGGTKPQNVSQLNTARRGKSYLLSCSPPPKWQNQQRPPTGKNAFWREYSRRARSTLNHLTGFLASVAEKNNVRIRDYRADLVDELIDLLVQYAAEVQSLREHAGWSAKSQLPKAEQLWLDPYRSDPSFNQLREAGDWQKEIADTFGRWLNSRLRKKDFEVTDVEHGEWASLVEKKLNRLRIDLGATA